MSFINVAGPVAQHGDMFSTRANLSRMFRIVGDVARAMCAKTIVFSADVACPRDSLKSRLCTQVPVPQCSLTLIL